MKPFPLAKKINDLEDLERYFQRPDVDLAEAIGKHQEAILLAKEILAYLEEAQTTIEQIDIQQTLAHTDDAAQH